MKWFGPDGTVDTDKAVNIRLDEYDIFSIELAIHTMNVAKKHLPECEQKLLIEGAMKCLESVVDRCHKAQAETR